MTTTNSVSFTQSIQGANIMTVPTYSDLVLQPLVATKAPTYPEF